MFLPFFPYPIIILKAVIVSIRATCATHPNILNFIILVIFGDELKSRSSSLCSFLKLSLCHSPRALTISSASPTRRKTLLVSSRPLQLCDKFDTSSRFLLSLILIFKTSKSRREDKTTGAECRQPLCCLNLFLISSLINFALPSNSSRFRREQWRSLAHDFTLASDESIE
jgi:hypothetical protein